MTLFPIVERELRVASRQGGTYWSRFGAAALALAAGTWMYAVNKNSPPSELGAEIFVMLAICLFLYILVAGIQVTCDCLSEEKREGTLGLLFLTDLKGYDVVLGKLSATSLRVCYGILALVPILAIPLLMGGVGYGQFWRVILTALDLLFFSLTTGILASSLCQSGAKSLGVAALISGVFLALAPLVVFIVNIQGISRLDFLLVISPAYDCAAAFDDVYVRYTKAFWTNVILTQLYSWLFLFLACRIAARSWRDETPAPLVAWRRLRRCGAWLATGFLAQPTQTVRVTVGDLNPYAWRCRVNFRLRRWLWAVVIGMTLLALLIHGLDNNRDVGVTGFLFFPILINILVKCCAMFQITQDINEDRRSGGLELLLATPLSEKDLIRGLRQAFWKQFWPLSLFILAMDALFLPFFHSYTKDLASIVYYVVLASTLVSDLYAISWVGVWSGLVSRTATRAGSLVFLKVMVLPSILTIVLTMTFNPDNQTQLFIVWGVVNVFSAMIFSLLSHRSLKLNFRTQVASPGK